MTFRTLRFLSFSASCVLLCLQTPWKRYRQLKNMSTVTSSNRTGTEQENNITLLRSGSSLYRTSRTSMSSFSRSSSSADSSFDSSSSFLTTGWSSPAPSSFFAADFLEVQPQFLSGKGSICYGFRLWTCLKKTYNFISWEPLEFAQSIHCIWCEILMYFMSAHPSTQFRYVFIFGHFRRKIYTITSQYVTTYNNIILYYLSIFTTIRYLIL